MSTNEKTITARVTHVAGPWDEIIEGDRVWDGQQEATAARAYSSGDVFTWCAWLPVGPNDAQAEGQCGTLEEARDAADAWLRSIDSRSTT